MVDLNDAVSLLQAKRKDLADQLDAVDKALAALGRVAGRSDMAEKNSSVGTSEAAPAVVVPTRLKPRRTLSADHRHALSEGRRKAHHSKAAAAGLARELSDHEPALAPASNADRRHPRLVKQTK